MVITKKKFNSDKGCENNNVCKLPLLLFFFFSRMQAKYCEILAYYMEYREF